MILRFFGQLSANVVQTFSISDQANSSPYCQEKKHCKQLIVLDRFPNTSCSIKKKKQQVCHLSSHEHEII